MNILLIRHGETLWNREGRIQGQQDIPLSALGEEQARQIGQRLAEIPLVSCYTSDSSRALVTAKIALGKRPIPLTVLSGWRERNFGQWGGLTWAEIQRDQPVEAQKFDSDPVGYAPPGGETWNQMQDRVFSSLKEIPQTHPRGTVAVFTHGGPCKAAVYAALKISSEQWRRWVTHNGSIQTLIWDSDSSKRAAFPWKLAGFNDIRHLSVQEANDTLSNDKELENV